jgi:alpha-ketoglutaric semialdehyde dehydrogenase
VSLTTAPGETGCNYIGGQWTASATGESYSRQNPMWPPESLGPFAASSTRDVESAVTAARDALAEWSSASLAQRAHYLREAARGLESVAPEAATLAAREIGKPIREATAEVIRAAQVLRYAADHAFRPVGEVYEQSAGGAQVVTRRRPRGVVGLITPWNFPYAIPAWKLGPALACGNTVVLKLSHDAPASGTLLARCFADAGLPSGVLNVLTGSGSTIGPTLVGHEHVDALSFTGSVEVGMSVSEGASRRGAAVQLEMGGHNPVIVMADADIAKAVEATFVGAFSAAGQKCTATRRIFVQDEVYDTFRTSLLGRIDLASVGDPLDPSTDVGPVVNHRQFQEIIAAIDRGVTQGGLVIAGGTPVDGDEYLIPRQSLSPWLTTRSCRARRSLAPSRASTAFVISTRQSTVQTRCGLDGRRRFLRRVFRARHASNSEWRQGFSMSTPRQLAQTYTSHSGGSSRAVRDTVNRDAPRSTSTRKL